MKTNESWSSTVAAHKRRSECSVLCEPDVVDGAYLLILCIVGRRGKAAPGAGVRAERRTGFWEAPHSRTAAGFGAKPGKPEQAAVAAVRQGVRSVRPASGPEGAPASEELLMA